jgi:hypothetical protein
MSKSECPFCAKFGPPTSTKYYRLVKDSNGKKYVWIVSEEMAKKLDSFSSYPSDIAKPG